MTTKHKKEIVRIAKRIAHAEKIFDIPKGHLENSINKFINIEFNYDLRDYINNELNRARNLI